DHLAEDGAGAEQLYPRRAFLRLAAVAEQVHALADAFLHALRHGRVRVVLVHHGDVVEDALALLVHPPQAVLDDHRQLVSEGGIVGNAVRNHRGEHVAVTVLVPQALAVERGTAGRTAQQEATGARIGGGPGEVADTLEAEHGVTGVEGDYRHAVVGVGRPGGDPRRHRTGFGDAFLQDLALLVLLVEHQLVGILRRIQLTDRGIDAQLAE